MGIFDVVWPDSLVIKRLQNFHVETAIFCDLQMVRKTARFLLAEAMALLFWTTAFYESVASRLASLAWDSRASQIAGARRRRVTKSRCHHPGGRGAFEAADAVTFNIAKLPPYGMRQLV